MVLMSNRFLIVLQLNILCCFNFTASQGAKGKYVCYSNKYTAKDDRLKKQDCLLI